MSAVGGQPRAGDVDCSLRRSSTTGDRRGAKRPTHGLAQVIATKPGVALPSNGTALCDEIPSVRPMDVRSRDGFKARIAGTPRTWRYPAGTDRQHSRCALHFLTMQQPHAVEER